MNPNQNPLSTLDPREKLDPGALLKDLGGALIRAQETGFYERLLNNMRVRYCQWEGQSWDGRKWGKEGRRLRPGDSAPDVFPWPGASDTRVRKVDEIINERVGYQVAAYDRADVRIGPRDLMTDQELVQQSALWSMVYDYYLEEDERGLRQQTVRWADLKEAYGHSILYVDWRTSRQQDRREINQEQLMQLVAAAALDLAGRAAAAAAGPDATPPNEDGTFLPPDQVQAIQEQAMRRLGDMIEDPEERAVLAEQLRLFDPAMTRAESLRVASRLRSAGAATYYVPVVHDEGLHVRALCPYVDVFYPPETASMKAAAWVAMPEWVTDVQLRERVESADYRKAWVDAVIEKGAGLTALSELQETASLREVQWVASGGLIGRNLSKALVDGDAKLWQIMHVYYRATTTTGVPALFHTIVHSCAPDDYGVHECCEAAHGEYPFQESVAQLNRDCLLDCEGVGEISFTYQQEIKTQRDMRSDNASIQMQPPSLVPLNHGGGRVSYRPGAQMAVRMAGGMGKPEFVRIPADAGTSREIEEATLRSLDALWFRGKEVDPEVKQMMAQNLTNNFLQDLKAARKLMWKLIQQHCSDAVKAGVVRGVPVSLQASREDIQGGVSMTMTFDVGDLNADQAVKKAELFKNVIQPLDRTGNIPTDEILRVVLGSLAPGWARLLLRPPEKVATDEIQDEQRALSEMLNGIEPAYVPGKDHSLRLQVLQEAISKPGPNGEPTRVQRILQESPDVQELVQNRMKFHAFQVEQTQRNPSIGRLGVEPVQRPALQV